MKHIVQITFLAALCFLSGGCTKEKDAEEVTIETIEDLTVENFPTIDGSDSTLPLRRILASRLLGIEYYWGTGIIEGTGGYLSSPIHTVYLKYPGLDYENRDTFLQDSQLKQKLQDNNTHQSFINLIDGTVDLIITARSISRDEEAYRQKKGVAITEKPIAKDAFIFLVNPANPVIGLTIAQIQGIYTGDITNWAEVGGNDATITPYVRNPNSGSQEKMETLVMAGLKMIDGSEMDVVGNTMFSPYWQIAWNVNGIGYTPFYYYSTIVNSKDTRALGVNGTVPSKESIADNTYPYVTEIYAAVRSDINKSSPAYKIFEYLSDQSCKTIIDESGYITYDI